MPAALRALDDPHWATTNTTADGGLSLSRRDLAHPGRPNLFDRDAINIWE